MDTFVRERLHGTLKSCLRSIFIKVNGKVWNIRVLHDCYSSLIRRYMERVDYFTKIK